MRTFGLAILAGTMIKAFRRMTRIPPWAVAPPHGNRLIESCLPFTAGLDDEPISELRMALNMKVTLEDFAVRHQANRLI